MNVIESGTLNDAQIIACARNKKLIIEEFKEENVKQACYELRAGNIYFDFNGDEVVRHEIGNNDEIVFRPHQTLIIISKEKFKFPDDILGRFLTKGALTSLGFVPVNTYADPGFYGRMGMIMNNASNHYLRIPCGEPISKVEFVKLRVPVDQAYFGQHGFETGVWPFREDLVIPPDRVRKYFPGENDIDVIRASFGDSAARIMHRVLVTERRFVLATVILIILNLVIIGLSLGTSWISPVANVIYGIIANVGYAIVSLIVSKIKVKKTSGK
ncbi:MAG: hypothetical protein J5789_05340 [Oscillospiraceae bacterium]|nr:hypothetical protein [Oscillospiraceae bacterium]